jgi:hypothetical protein
MCLISNKWKILIIRDLLNGTKRFGELQRTVSGISQKVLTSNLKELESDGLINRKVYPVVPPKVEYSLTDLGFSLKPVLDSMIAWGNENRHKVLGQE